MTTMKYFPWVLLVIGIWLIVAPFLLGYGDIVPAAMGNEITVGAVIALSALVWGVSERRHNGLSTNMRR